MMGFFCRPAGMALFVLLAVLSRTASAQDREVQPLRNAQGQLVKQGYRIWIDRTQRGNGGYLPVRVKLQAVPPLVTDSVATIELDDQYNLFNGGTVLVEQDAILPAGQSNPIDIEILLPAISSGTQFECRVWIDGELERGLSTFLPALSHYQNFNTNILSAAANPATILGLNLSAGNAGVQFTSLEAFPESWLGYTQFDIVHLPFDNLQELSDKHPQACRALVNWVASGGNLWIEQADGQFQDLPQLDELLNSAVAPNHSSISADWQRPTSMTGGSVLIDSNHSHRPRIEWDPQTGQPIEIAPPAKPSQHQSAKKLDTIRVRSLGLGLVAVFQNSVNETMPDVLSNGIPKFAELSRVTWIIRNGVEPFNDNDDFWDWLIPGVGLPPVLAFQILITLFVIGIGPLNYFLLRRKRRLYLLVVTVPLSAVLITAGLFGYAVLADGFHVRVRTRSFTELDQRLGQAACWSRQTYYAGVAPSDGLHFPTDMAVYPKEVGVHSRRQNRQSGRVLRWGEDQHLAEGWLRSRTTTQFMCVRSRTSSAELQIASTMGQPLAVTNKLGSPILQLVLRDANGKYFGGENIDANATVELDASAAPTAAAAARLTILDAQPQPLAINQSYSPSNTPTGYESLLEASIEEVRRALSGNLDLAPNSYIAIVKLSPEVAYGCDARQEGSLHIVRGRW